MDSLFRTVRTRDVDLNFNGVAVPAAQVHATMMAALEFGYGTVTSTQDYLSAA